jgi:acetolactate synthase-1/3 small subunit
MKHTIQALVENKFGVLARIASLFSARGYNINSLAVGETQDKTVSCMTIVVNAEDERILEQIKKQLHKLIDVITVVDLTRKDHIDRELILLKVPRSKNAKEILHRLATGYPVKILEEKDSSFILEVCGTTKDIEEIFKELNKLDIKKMVRTGKIVIDK